MDLDCWNASSSKAPALKDGSAAYQVVVGVAYLLAYDGYGL